jgi:hypothetical protein
MPWSTCAGYTRHQADILAELQRLRERREAVERAVAEQDKREAEAA